MAGRGRAKATRKKGSKGKASARSAEPWSERRWVRTSGLVLACVVGAAMLGGAGYAVVAADRAGEGRLAEATVEIDIEWPVTRMGPDQQLVYVHDRIVRSEIEAQVRALALSKPSPFDASGLADIGTFLWQSGWFDAAPTVERSSPATIRIRGEWRRPVAIVRFGRGDLERDYLIDAQLRLLPKVYAPGERTGRFISGVTHAPFGQAPWRLDFEEPWPDGSLRAALDLLMLLSQQPFASQVVGVDARDYFVENKLAIITDRGSRVVWGGPVGEFVPGEATTQQKLTHLLQFYSDPAYGRRIDAGLDRLEVFDRQVVIDRTR